MKLIFDSARFGEFRYKGLASIPGAEQLLLCGLIFSAATPFILSKMRKEMLPSFGRLSAFFIVVYFCFHKPSQDKKICDLEQEERKMRVNFEYTKRDDCLLYDKINGLRDELENFTALVNNTKALRIFSFD